MIKRLSYLFLLLAIIAIAALAALYGALRSQYATSLVNYLLNITHSEIQVEQASYTPPLQLTLEGVRFASDDTFYLPKVELWFAATLPNANNIQLDAVVIEGANLALQSDQKLSPLAQLATRLTTKQLAIKHSDLSWGELSARNGDVQIEQPVWKQGQGLPFGNIQFAADQLYYQGHALNNLLVDVNYQAQDSTVYGASFEWNGGQVSGQAEQYPQGWSLINVTVDGLNLTQTQNELSWLNELAKSGWIRDINSLDILKSNLSYQGIELLNLDLSVANINPSASIWQQKQGYLSFNADTLNYQGEQFVAPSATLYFSPQNIEIAELDTDWQQGRVQLQGQVSPDAIQLKSLTISGAKWLDISAEKLTSIAHWGDKIAELTIAQLDINNAQLIQINNKPFWQASGVNVEGKQLTLKQHNKLGLWQGSLQITANSVSYANYLSTQAIIEMSNKANVWQLDRLFLPLETGYIEASGRWDRQQLSAPWQLDFTVDGLPFEQQLTTRPAPLHLSGISDWHGKLNGLAGDYSMFAHSLSGSIDASLRDSQLSVLSPSQTTEQEKSEFSHNFALDKLIITADRGRITLNSPNETPSAQLAGKIDLAKPQLATVLLQLEDKCQRLQLDLSAKAYQIEDICPQLNTQQTLPAPQQSSLESSN